MTIDKYKQPDGSYIGPDCCTYRDAEDFLITGIMGFCGCGFPDQALQHIRDVLQLIHELKSLIWDNKLTTDQWYARELKVFGSVGAAYFTYYVFDNLKLTEHGGSVPGWLTQKGIDLLNDINELYPHDNRTTT